MNARQNAMFAAFGQRNIPLSDNHMNVISIVGLQPKQRTAVPKRPRNMDDEDESSFVQPKRLRPNMNFYSNDDSFSDNPIKHTQPGVSR